MAAAVLRRPVQHCHRRNSVKPKICGGIESVKVFPKFPFLFLPETSEQDVSMYQRYPLLRYQPNCFAWFSGCSMTGTAQGQ
jgi:hypothetical protein